MLIRIDNKEDITPGALVTHKQYGSDKALGVVIEQRERLERVDLGGRPEMMKPVMRCTVCWVVAPDEWLNAS